MNQEIEGTESRILKSRQEISDVFIFDERLIWTRSWAEALCVLAHVDSASCRLTLPPLL